jgi:hypothetical protein
VSDGSVNLVKFGLGAFLLPFLLTGEPTSLLLKVLSVHMLSIPRCPCDVFSENN